MLPCCSAQQHARALIIYVSVLAVLHLFVFPVTWTRVTMFRELGGICARLYLDGNTTDNIVKTQRNGRGFYGTLLLLLKIWSVERSF